MAKQTKHDAPPEPIGWLTGFGVIDTTPIAVWECELCLALSTDLGTHKQLTHAIASS